MKSFLSYSDRLPFCQNILGKKLLSLITEKQTNLAFSADVTQARQLLELADLIGPEICILKTHIDILEDFSLDFIEALKKIASKHRFLIFEDRKFADIGHTVKLQYEKGMYHIADWADIVNAHTLPGPGIIKALSEAGLAKQRGLLLLAEMSSAGNLLDQPYAKKTLGFAEEYADFVFGFISQRKLSDNPAWIYLTPGVQFQTKNDALGQQYVTPETAIVDNGVDVIIVGRGILQADDPKAAAKLYRTAGWDAYKCRVDSE